MNGEIHVPNLSEEHSLDDVDVSGHGDGEGCHQYTCAGDGDCEGGHYGGTIPEGDDAETSTFCSQEQTRGVPQGTTGG